MPRVKKSNLSRKAAKSLILVILALATVWVTDQIAFTPQISSDVPVQIYSNQAGADLRGIILNSIKEAKQSILLIIYTLNDEGIIKALREKSEQGIKVKVICDAKASPWAPRKLGKEVTIIRRNKSPALMHQKILVIDESQILIGSANFTPDSLVRQANLVLGFYSPEMARTIAEKADKMPKQGKGETVTQQKYLIGGQLVELWFLPDCQNAPDRIKELLQSANKTVRVAMFTWTREDFAQELIHAKERGVIAEAVIDHNSSKGSSAKIAQLFASKQFPLLIGPSNKLLHHKLLLIDDKTLVNGSANWTLAAFTKNDDCFIILHDLTDQQKSCLERMWKTIQDEAS